MTITPRPVAPILAPLTAHAVRRQLYDALDRREQLQVALAQLDDVIHQLRQALRDAERRER